jgi:hypothetical protein
MVYRNMNLGIGNEAAQFHLYTISCEQAKRLLLVHSRYLGEFALPPGSIILFSSLSHLHTEGLANYSAECINVVRRFNSMFKSKTITLPIAPTPLCGIPDPDSVRSLFDSTLWLDSTPNYCLGRYNQAVRDCISSSVSEGSGVTHYPGRLYLPVTTDDFPTKRFERPGRADFPGSIPPLSVTADLYPPNGA